MSIMIASPMIVLVAAVWLTARHFYASEASARSKRLLIYIGTASILIGMMLPALFLVGTLLQAAICAYVILYNIALRGEPTTTDPSVSNGPE